MYFTFTEKSEAQITKYIFLRGQTQGGAVFNWNTEMTEDQARPSYHVGHPAPTTCSLKYSLNTKGRWLASLCVSSACGFAGGCLTSLGQLSPFGVSFFPFRGPESFLSFQYQVWSADNVTEWTLR